MLIRKTETSNVCDNCKGVDGNYVLSILIGDKELQANLCFKCRDYLVKQLHKITK